jgi:hypothetical protein
MEMRLFSNALYSLFDNYGISFHKVRARPLLWTNRMTVPNVGLQRSPAMGESDTWRLVYGGDIGQCQGICQLESEGDPLLILALLLAPPIEGQLLQVLALLLPLVLQSV